MDRKQYLWEYVRRPEVKERARLRSKSPERIEKRKAYQKEYYSRPEVKERIRKYGHSDKVSETKRKYYSRPEVRERIRLLSAERRKKPYFQCKKNDYRYRSQYGISLEEYNNILSLQNGVCAICHKEETKIIRGIRLKLAIDHCHESNKVRGLLCSECNTALGKFYDDIEILNNAINYLNKNK